MTAAWREITTPLGESCRLFHGDCLDVLRDLPDASVDSIVTDPPAGIRFMGRAWDSDMGGRHSWVAWLSERMTEAYRVLKPGGYGLVWALPRTSHWTAWALEDARSEVRDCVVHLFGTGFPKSLDVSRAIDLAAGVDPDQPSPVTDAAKQYAGFGTALKPAAEHWWLVRKPLIGTVATNVLEFGTGALNIDGCRVGSGLRTNHAGGSSSLQRVSRVEQGYRPTVTTSIGTDSIVSGRWPSNVVLSHQPLIDPVTGEVIGDACADGCVEGCPVRELDAQSGVTSSKSGGITSKALGVMNDDSWVARDLPRTGHDDAGGASRFFPTFRWQAKAPTAQRPRLNGQAHPTVKPLDLMRWLTRLVTQPGGVVLDCFAGTGVTGQAARLEGFRSILIEQDPESIDLILTRLDERLSEGTAWVMADPDAPEGRGLIVEQNDLFGESA